MAFETRLTPAMAARWRGAGLWGDETLATVLARRVGETPDREALTDGTHRLTYRELAHGIDRMAARLRALGIGVGDVVTIQLPNWVEFAFVFFALERLGAVAVTVSVDFRSRELEYIMRFAGSKMLVCCGPFRDFDHVAMAAELKPKLPALECIGVIRGVPRADEPGSGRVSSARSRASSDAPCARTPVESPRWPLASLAGAAGPDMVSLDDVAAGSGPPAGFVPVPMNADTIMRMAFTSGTTGNPKGVMHSHNTTLAAARILNGDVGLSTDDVMMIWLPLGLNWGYLTLIQSILAGAKAVLLDRFRPGTALDLIERERVTYIPTAPASLTTILQEPELAGRDLSSLRIVVSGGASAPVETIRAWRRAVLATPDLIRGSGQRGHSISPPGILLELLGMLETGYQAYTRATDDPEQVAGSVGRPASHMGLKLVDADGREVARGEEGDICCDGPSVHLGYHNNPAANAEAFLPDGWFRSGDLGVIDPDGNLRIVGRLKEMINRGGKKFFPREIEEILYTHRASALRRDRRHSRPAVGRAQLPVPGASPRRDADARKPRRLPRRQRRHLQAAGAPRAVHAIPVHPDRQDPAPRARARGRGANVSLISHEFGERPMDERYGRFSRLLIDRPHPRVLRVVMNRPDKLNAADGEMHSDLAEIWRVIDTDPSVNAVLLTGAGKAFSAGGDLDLVDKMMTRFRHPHARLEGSARHGLQPDQLQQAGRLGDQRRGGRRRAGAGDPRRHFDRRQHRQADRWPHQARRRRRRSRRDHLAAALRHGQGQVSPAAV